MIPREADITKQENQAASSSSTRSKQDPRIVRVSKAFGGKDRHSKVCTVRGLRDRRVRLSVPTAIQLYDLQDRLGLNQPSKVVDWLLNAAKHEIDELPPLQIPPGSFLPGNEANWERREEGERQLVTNAENPNSVVSGQDFLNSSSSIPYNSVLRWDPSNLTLSHPPRNHGLSEDNWPNFSSQHHQFLVYQPGISTHTYFPPQLAAANFQISSSSPIAPPDEPVIRPINFNITANLLPEREGQTKNGI